MIIKSMNSETLHIMICDNKVLKKKEMLFGLNGYY